MRKKMSIQEAKEEEEGAFRINSVGRNCQRHKLVDDT